MRKTTELSVIIPAWNEVKRLPLYLLKVEKYLQARHPGAYEIIVVDDGSTDGTAEAAARCIRRGRVEKLGQNRGKGAAVRHGMLHSEGGLRLFTDADGAVPIEEEQRLARAIAGGVDLAIGSRMASGGKRHFLLGGRGPMLNDETPEPTPQWRVRAVRHYTGRAYSFLVRSLLGLNFLDTQCGFKMFTAESAQSIFSLCHTNGFAFDVEVLAVARHLGFRSLELGVHWTEVRGSKVNVFRDGPPMYLELYRIRRRLLAAIDKKLEENSKRAA